MKYTLWNRTASLLTASAMTAALALPAALPVQAENFQFVTEIRLETGENAYDTLEAAGFHVMSVGLNAEVSAADQIYLGYKYNTGAPITGLLISGDVGDSLEQDGITYECASHTDVDAGNGGGAGCIYITRDERAGAPLVGLDILKADAAEGEELLPIANDGAEVVRRPDGTPCDIERHSEMITMYLAQIRDGLVAPYISEIMPITDVSRWDAVYTAAERGYDYFIDGDIDDNADTYTLIAYKRTADAAQAITSIAAVSADMIRSYEENQIVDTPETTEQTTEAQSETETETEEVLTAEVGLFAPLIVHADELSEADSTDAEMTEEPGTEPESSETEALPEETEPESSEASETEMTEETAEEATEAPTEPETVLTGDAIGISGVEYFRTSRTEIPGETPYYLYATKDPEAGNPVMMLYAETLAEPQESLFGMWAYSYFSAKGGSNAYSFKCNEDLLLAFRSDKTVCTKLPVELHGVGQNADDEASAEAEGNTGTVDAEQTTGTTDENAVIRLIMLTAKDGLPASAAQIGGLRTPTYETPQLERNERSNRKNKFPASVFGEKGGFALALGGVAVVCAAVAGAFLHKHHKPAIKSAQEDQTETQTEASGRSVQEQKNGNTAGKKNRKRSGKRSGKKR